MIAAVVVTFNPMPGQFELLLKVLVSQVDLLCVVDNSPSSNNTVADVLISCGLGFDQVRVVRLGRNAGIATALNIGIEIGLSEGAEFLLLSDQDSLPASDMVKSLARSLEGLLSEGEKVAAVGPVFQECNTDKVHPFQVQIPGHLFYGHGFASAESPLVDALTLITSGCLIQAAAIRDVGLMRDEYFVDGVDLEWSHRARAKGYRLVGVNGATMRHEMGEDRLRVWYLRWRMEAEYPPLRLYYRVRNLIALTRESYVDLSWKLRNSWAIAGVVYSHLIFGTRRLDSLKMVCVGLWHGVVGKMGPYSMSVKDGASDLRPTGLD
ncbi:glycosyltransferase family 2 protein [Congregibacter variabilis]|uniref:Glycosyltransferase family 2 protein n=1 Tax=Congregibacter variabilis TaxID=3081200 RepID=A0ABZ0I208_9GAMM|nr:glycosyltransferase family 2 protein [Congregibacter sp. IMCC43200]